MKARELWGEKGHEPATLLGRKGRCKRVPLGPHSSRLCRRPDATHNSRTHLRVTEQLQWKLRGCFLRLPDVLWGRGRGRACIWGKPDTQKPPCHVFRKLFISECDERGGGVPIRNWSLAPGRTRDGEPLFRGGVTHVLSHVS